jgi:hypothetical protein
MDHGDYSGLISACARYGDPASGGDSQLWAAALEYFAGQPGECSSEVCDVLARVEEGGWLAPMQVGGGGGVGGGCGNGWLAGWLAGWLRTHTHHGRGHAALQRRELLLRAAMRWRDREREGQRARGMQLAAHVPNASPATTAPPPAAAQVLQILSANTRLPVELVKGYVARHLQSQVRGSLPYRPPASPQHALTSPQHVPSPQLPTHTWHGTQLPSAAAPSRLATGREPRA